ncbi:MAG: DUF1800 domain-containing protein [Novosphingobium sp.]
MTELAEAVPAGAEEGVEIADDALPSGARAFAGASLLALAACGGGGGGSGGGPIGGGPAPTPTPTVAPISATQASRFLSQAAIGYSRADIANVTSQGFGGWLDSQYTLGRPQKFWDFLIAGGYDNFANQNNQAGFDPMMWSQLMSGADVLRQRVGLALLSQWVVSIDGIATPFRQFSMAAYLDGLWDNAFGNYRNIMEAVSTSTAMGLYLTFLGNRKANAATGSIPDENYARELMQLFTIGLSQLNMDGTLNQPGGQPVPTYTQADVGQAARVWTGYTYANSVTTTPARHQLGMIVNAANFETGGASFLGINIPIGSDGATARRVALDGLFQHPNVPPFVAKQLIQHLVTSNPSPAYVQRVANVFANNGSGVRGDMKEVVRAALLDPEARDDTAIASQTFGKLREPVVRLVQWARAFRVTSPTNAWPFGNTNSTANRIGESPGRAPSVFNFFRPGYVPPGTTLAANNLVAPEFQITSEPSLIAYTNYMQTVIQSGAGEARPDYSALAALAGDSQALLDELNLLLAAGQIHPTVIGQMKTALDSIANTTNRTYAAVLLVMASPDYLVLR